MRSIIRQNGDSPSAARLPQPRDDPAHPRGGERGRAALRAARANRRPAAICLPDGRRPPPWSSRYLFLVLAVLWLASRPGCAACPTRPVRRSCSLRDGADRRRAASSSSRASRAAAARRALLRWLRVGRWSPPACCSFYFHLRARALSPAITEARLQALQARIRPHFLFNSINARAVAGAQRAAARRSARCRTWPTSSAC